MKRPALYSRSASAQPAVSPVPAEVTPSRWRMSALRKRLADKQLHLLWSVVGLLALLLTGAWRAASAASQGQADGAALLAAMAAFGTVGLIDTLVDAPRFMLLCLLLCLLPGVLARR